MPVRGRVLLCLLSFATIVPRSAHAQLGEEVAAARRALIADAQRASLSGDHRRALELAERAGQLRMSGTLRRFLAEEHQALGDAVHALASAQLCVEEFERDPTARDRARHLTACRTILHWAEPRVGSIVAQVASDAPTDLHITVASNEVPRALWGVAVPVEPGDVEIDAHASGFVDFHRSVHVDAGASATVSIALEAVPPAVQASAEPEASASPPPVVSSSTAPPPPSASPSPAPIVVTPSRHPSVGSVAPWALGGLGSAALSVTIAFAIVRQVSLDAYDRDCPPSGMCLPQAVPEYNTAHLFNDLTNATMIAGGVLALAGGAWLSTRGFLARRRVGASVGPRGLALRFEF